MAIKSPDKNTGRNPVKKLKISKEDPAAFATKRSRVCRAPFEAKE